MIDSTIVRANVEQHILNKYKTLSPYINERQKDEVVTLFMIEVAMKAVIDESAELGESPGVEESVVKEKEIGNAKVESVKQETEPKFKIIDQPLFYIFLALIVLLFILLIYK